jgi:hypothetical protein
MVYRCIVRAVGRVFIDVFLIIIKILRERVLFITLLGLVYTIIIQ